MSQIESKTKECVSETLAVTILPEVDVQVNPDGVCLKIDLPGVDSNHLNIQLDKQILTVQGEIVLQEKSTFVIDELAGQKYEQSFTLSSELDTERISASLHEGVLTLSLPKKEALKPRKIEVKTE
ncbi:MAG: Hsp20/alpha crystallin family protein [Planctomycetota bacterium]